MQLFPDAVQDTVHIQFISNFDHHHQADDAQTGEIVDHLARNVEALKKLKEMYGIAFQFDTLLSEIDAALQGYRALYGHMEEPSRKRPRHQ